MTPGFRTASQWAENPCIPKTHRVGIPGLGGHTFECILDIFGLDGHPGYKKDGAYVDGLHNTEAT